MQIILASTSKFRKKQIEDMGLDFMSVAPLFDEESYKSKEIPPSDLCLLLAKKKAQSLTLQYPKAIIIGSDQILVFEEKMYNKPNSKADVVERLSQLQGKTHTLLTALYVHSPAKKFHHLETCQLHMKKMNAQEIENYYLLDNPIGCAGAYKYEKNGHKLFDKVITDDLSSIIGLPTKKLKSIITQLNQGPSHD